MRIKQAPKEGSKTNSLPILDIFPILEKLNLFLKDKKEEWPKW